MPREQHVPYLMSFGSKQFALIPETAEPMSILHQIATLIHVLGTISLRNRGDLQPLGPRQVLKQRRCQRADGAG
jgi:hypothetical protein